MNHSHSKKLLSVLLTLAMIFALSPVAATPAWASTVDNVSYLYFADDIAAITGHYSAGTANSCTVVTGSNSDETWSDGWYTASGDITIDGKVTIGSDVKLILCDDCRLTITKGILMNGGAGLAIYSQSRGSDQGTLFAGCYLNGTAPAPSNDANQAGIGGLERFNITIHGGVIFAMGGVMAPGIGGNEMTYLSADMPKLTIHGGEVHAYGTDGGAGIGNKCNSNGNFSVVINGGNVFATGGDGNAGAGAGIGNASNCTSSNGLILVINGGNVTANGGTAGTGGAGAGIGGGGSDSSIGSNGGTVTINGGVVTATGGNGKQGSNSACDDCGGCGAGIGGGGSGVGQNGGAGGTLTVNGGKVVATGGGIHVSNHFYNGAAGIGGGGSNHTIDSSTGANVTINGGYVDATGGYKAAGIGGGRHSTNAGKTVAINGGYVLAHSEYRIGSSFIGSGSELSNTQGQIHGTLTYSAIYVNYVPVNNVVDGSEASTKPICYTDYDGTDTPTDITWSDTHNFVSSTSTVWSSGLYTGDGWYVVRENVTIPERVAVTGAVNLIIFDDATLTAEKGIEVPDDAELNIYIGKAESNTEDIAGTGAVVATGASGAAGIGGSAGCAGGTVSIHGGKITASGSGGGAGIGAGSGYIGSTPGTVKNAFLGTGWDNAAGTGAGELIAVSTSGRSLSSYPRVAFPAYSVTFDGNGSTGGTMEPQSIPIGATTSLAAIGFSKLGYSFSGWNTLATPTAENPGVPYANEADITLTGNLTLYAQWAIKTSNITFDKQNGTGGSDTATATYGAVMPTITLPTKAYCHFIGYYDTATGGTRYYSPTGVSAHAWDKEDATATLYAHWSAPGEHAVYFDSKGGTTVDEQYVTDGGTAAQPENPTKSGFSFVEWRKSGESQAYDFTAPVNSDITLEAQWLEDATQPITPSKHRHRQSEDVSTDVPAEEVITPPAPDARVVLSPQQIMVNGVAAAVEAYNIGGTNFFKLRDLAALLRGTSSQFNVDYDMARRAVLIARGLLYDGEVGTTFTDKSESAARSTQFIEIDGKTESLLAYNIGGNNFFGLRELALFLGYSVTYDEATNTARIESK